MKQAANDNKALHANQPEMDNAPEGEWLKLNLTT